MPRHGLALLALLAVSPAHATLLDYSFEGQSRPSADETFGLEIGGTISGALLWDEAPTQFGEPYPGTASTSSYAMSNLLWWVILGDQTFTARGGKFAMRDTPSSLPASDDVWDFTRHSDRYETDGYSVAGLIMQGMTLTEAGSQAPVATSFVPLIPDSMWNSWWGNSLGAGLLIASLLWWRRRGTGTAAAATAQRLSTATTRRSLQVKNGAAPKAADQEASPKDAREPISETQAPTIDEPAQLVPNSDDTSVARIEQLAEAGLCPEQGQGVPVAPPDPIGGLEVAMEQSQPSIAEIDGGALRDLGAAPDVTNGAEQALPSSETGSGADINEPLAVA